MIETLNKELILSYLLCFVYSCVAFGRLCLFIITDGLKSIQIQTIKKKPAVLTEEEWGQHRYVTLKQQGVKLHYVEKGDRSKPLMLMLHGFPECWLSWRHQIEEFSTNYWVVAVDMRGYGESDKPIGRSHYTLDKLVGDIEEFITELGKPKCILVSHDWGGVVAWKLVEQSPQLVEKHISVNGVSSEVFRYLRRTSLTQFFMSWYTYFFMCPFLPEIILGLKNLTVYAERMRGRKEHPLQITDEVMQGYLYYYSQKGALTPPLNYYRSMARKDVGDLVEDSVTVPTLIIWGAKDEALSIDIPKLLSKLCVNVTYEELKDNGHFAHEENPTAVNEIMHTFLRTN